MTFEEVVSHFNVKNKKADSVQCICPAHDDKKASLTISKGKDGKTVMYCHAGCDTADILAAVELKKSDLYEDDQKQQQSIMAEYDYINVTTGKYAYTRVRLDPKDFYIGIRNKNNIISKGLKGKSRKGAIFSCDTLQNIKAAIADGKHIFYCEGEKDVKTLKSKGYIGITCGAAEDWNKESAIVFKDANVIVLADNDDAGKKCAHIVSKDLLGVAKSVRWGIPTPDIKKGDISDYFIKQNHTVDDFEAFLKQTKDVTEEVGAGDGDGLPPIVSLADGWNDPLELPEPLIDEILRVGHKMLLAAPSKAGKSFLLMELCIAIAEGKEWLGFPCKQGKVLYSNLEIDPRSARNRFHEIYKELGIPADNVKNIDIWDLRGYAQTLDKLAAEMINRTKGVTYVAVILDPIYKVIMGDENNASDMGNFCNQFDKICTEMGVSSIYCHHHSKGAQGGKKAMDRASGSGVFARDPDAQIDMIELVVPEEIKEEVGMGGATAWRIESSLREFKNIKPLNVWFKYPCHYVDTEGVLDAYGPDGSDAAARTKSSNFSTPEIRRKKFEEAYNYYQSFNENGLVTIKDIAAYCGVDDRTIRNWLNKDLKEEYENKRGIVCRLVPFDDQEVENGKQEK